YYKKTKDEDSLSAQRQLQKMLDGLKVQVPDEKAKTLRKIYTLSFEADTPQDAQDVLEQYIQDSAKTALQNLNEDVFNQIETSILWRQEEIARFDYQLKQQKQE